MFKPIIVLAALLGIQTIQAAETFELSSDMPNLQTVDNANKSDDWIEEHQKKIDEDAWKTFISLMWPANDNTRGEANADAAINDTSNLRVWETWKELYEVYLDNGNKPAAWHEFASLPKSCQTESSDLTTLHLYRTEKADDILDATHQAVKADATLPGTLTDQNGKLVRYDIRLNQTAFDYIIDKQFYNGKIQAQADNITFPNGSMVTKAAWRELTDDDAEKAHQYFVTRSACICDDENKDECHNAKVALVGFHTMKKTQDAPQWLWSTFEHVANVKPSHGLPASFNNPNCQGDYCTPNSQAPKGTPNQVTQLLPQSKSLQALNQTVQQSLQKQGSVLSNYQLMSAQWPLPNSKNPKTVFEVRPTLSTNTTMETYAQDTSSCMGCHSMARTLKPDAFVSADFSFTMNNAQPRPEGAVCDTYGYSNSVGCSKETILFNPELIKDLPVKQQKQITRGHEIAIKTYETLPDNVGNQLHCKSCHLHAGGDPNAAWWVDMENDYALSPADLDDKKDTTLAHRINGCFMRSMNGKPLCEDGKCGDNADMQSIIAYMLWLSDTYNKKHNCKQNPDSESCKTPPRGFPTLEEAVFGNTQHGSEIFLQKCAFCHNKDGEGRYESDTYFRPALWGNDSYNAKAGMISINDMLTQFLKGNMPYTSGESLTTQEAKDLACYVNYHTRPGKNTVGNPDDANCEDPCHDVQSPRVINNHQQAKDQCPTVCFNSSPSSKWNGQWTNQDAQTGAQLPQTVCGCCEVK